MSDYNGYSNRETWATALHLTNEQELYEFYKGRSAGEIKAGLYEIDYYSSDYTPRTNEILRDIGDLAKVNWDEVAETLKGIA